MATSPDASKAHSPSLPWRARLRFFRQRLILTVRWWFRLPIDDLRDRRSESLVLISQQIMALTTQLISVSNNMQQRLQYYEQNIPRMRELKVKFDLGARPERHMTTERPIEAEHGILTLMSQGQSNGKIVQ